MKNKNKELLRDWKAKVGSIMMDDRELLLISTESDVPYSLEHQKAMYDLIESLLEAQRDEIAGKTWSDTLSWLIESAERMGHTSISIVDLANMRDYR